MPSRIIPFTLLCLLGCGAARVHAQTRLTLIEAIAHARAHNPDAAVAAIGERQAEASVARARAGYWPKVDFTETWQRGNQPVFVFSSLLAQRRFTAANFEIDRLNHPDPVNNVRSAFAVEQIVFDGGAVRAGVHTASLGREAASVARRQVEIALAVQTTAAYGDVLNAMATERASAAAARAAEEDLNRARARHEAGVATEADVLAVEVHLARVREQEINATGAERTARTRLNQVIGAPLDETFALEDPVVPPDSTRDPVELDREALTNRPEIRQAALEHEIARAAVTSSRSVFLPQVGVQGGWEWNGDSLGTQVSSWVVGAELRVNLFHGFADRSRLAEAQAVAERRALERAKVETAVRLEVRQALAALETARAGELAGRAALSQAQERQRITRDRYEAGMVEVTTLLAAAQAVLDAESQATASRVAVLTRSAALDQAVGR